MSSSTLTAAAQSCAHCRQPLDAAAIEGRFCCSGCAGVFALLQGQGLSTYYRLAPEAPRPAPRPTGREYTEFSDPGFLARYAREEVQNTFVLWRKIGQATFYFQGGETRMALAMNEIPPEALRESDRVAWVLLILGGVIAFSSPLVLGIDRM